MSEPLNKGDLAKAFHQEMIDLARRHIELMAAINQAFSEGYSEDDIEAGISPGTRVVFGMRADYFAQADDLGRRFNAARIGDWNAHFEYCGARKMIEDDLGWKPG